MKKQNKAFLLAGLATIFWGTSASAFKIGLQVMDHYQLLFLASVTTLLFLFLLLIINGRLGDAFIMSKKEFMYSLVLGFINPFAYYVIVLKAYTLLPAQLAQPLNFIWPITLVLLSIPILKQKLSGKSIAALFLSFIGVFFIASEGKLDFQFADPFGVLLAMGSSVLWALFWLLNVKDKRDEVVKLFLNFCFSTLFIIITIPFVSTFQIESIKGLITGVYVGLFEMGITFVIWLKALQLTSSTDRIGNLIYLTPFFSLLFINLILDERIYYTTIIGVVLIITGIIWQQRQKKIKEAI